MMYICMVVVHRLCVHIVLHRDIKVPNILLDEWFNPKLSEGIAKLGPTWDKTKLSRGSMEVAYRSRTLKYTRTSKLTLKSDIYSIRVVLLELITGRRAINTRRPIEEQNLVSWVRPFFKDINRLPELADPLLRGYIPIQRFNQAATVAAICLHEEATLRPLISEVVIALRFLAMAPPDDVGFASPFFSSPFSLDKLSSDNKEKQDEDSLDECQSVVSEDRMGFKFKGRKQQVIQLDMLQINSFSTLMSFQIIVCESDIECNL